MLKADQPIESTQPFADSAGAADALIPSLYEFLRGRAREWMRDNYRGHTLQPTELVHEAYLKLAGRDDLSIRSEAHFQALAATVMRAALVDYVRRRDAIKRGGDRRRVSLTVADLPGQSVAHAPGCGESSMDQQVDLLAVHEALAQLERQDPEMAALVEMRFFGGMTIEAIAAVRGVCTRTVEREWAFARSWLRGRIEGNSE